MATVAVGPGIVASVQSQSALFVENGAATYTANFTLPANAILLDIVVVAEALWTAATSAALIVGDANDDDGYFTSTDLKATDLLVGESLALGSALTQAGGKTGAYASYSSSTHLLRGNTAANPTTTPVSGIDAARVAVTAKVTSVGAGTAGRTRVSVIYAVSGASSVGA